MPQHRDLLCYHCSSLSYNILIFHDDIIMNQQKQGEPWETAGPVSWGFPQELLTFYVDLSRANLNVP